MGSVDICYDQGSIKQCVNDQSIPIGLSIVDESFITRSGEKFFTLESTREVEVNTTETTIRTSDSETCLQVRNGSDVFVNCLDPFPIVLLTRSESSEGQFFNLRDSSREFCLSVKDENGTFTTNSQDLVLTTDLCFDSGTCSPDCSERERSQVFLVPSAQAVPSPTPARRPTNAPPSVVPYRPFDTTFEIIYQSALVAMMVFIIVLGVKKYNLFADSCPSATTGDCLKPKNRHEYLLEGVDIGQPKEDLK